MKEIGGYFGLEEFEAYNGEYHDSFTALNSARNALVYIVRAKKVEKLYIPYFLCDAVSSVCLRENIKFEYYHTDKAFFPKFNKEINSNEYLYIVNYYGQHTNEVLLALKNKYINIIIDNTHAFYQQPIEGVDTIYSCRKFFGVPDGAYLYTDKSLNETLPTDVSDNRTSHLYGRIKDGATAHYSEFKDNDKRFIGLPLMKMSDLTHKMLSVIDYNRIREIREANYRYLHEQLGKSNRLNLIFPVGPFAYPFYCENGIEIRKKLSEKSIYVPTLWPNVLELDNCTLEKEYAENILPLPIDQRYEEKDMISIIEAIIKIKK